MNRKARLCSICIGFLLIFAAIVLSVYNLTADFYAAKASSNVLNSLSHKASDEEDIAFVESSVLSEMDLPDYVLYPEMEMPTEHINGRDYIGVLEIPACGVTLPVIDEWDYPGLKVAPCRYDGSVYMNDLVIVAHNYPSHFGKLPDLVENDSVSFTDVSGNVFSFTVIGKEVITASDVEGMLSGEWDLTLFTCTVGGVNRIAIRCKLIENILAGG